MRKAFLIGIAIGILGQQAHRYLYTRSEGTQAWQKMKRMENIYQGYMSGECSPMQAKRGLEGLAGELNDLMPRLWFMDRWVARFFCWMVVDKFPAGQSTSHLYRVPQTG